MYFCIKQKNEYLFKIRNLYIKQEALGPLRSPEQQ